MVWPGLTWATSNTPPLLQATASKRADRPFHHHLTTCTPPQSQCAYICVALPEVLTSTTPHWQHQAIATMFRLQSSNLPTDPTYEANLAKLG